MSPCSIIALTRAHQRLTMRKLCRVPCWLAAGYLFRNAQYRLDLHRSMDDGEAAASQLPSGFQAQPLAMSATGESSSTAHWDGYAEGSQKTHVQVR